MLKPAFDPTAFPLTWKSRNLIRFCRHPGFDSLDPAFPADFALRAGMSRFSVLKNPKTLPGPDECHSHIQMDPRLVFEKMLGLELRFPEWEARSQKEPTLFNTMTCFRSHIEERFFYNGIKPLPPVEGLCLMFSPQPDLWRLTYRIANTSRVPVRLLLRWLSVPAPARRVEAAPDRQGFRLVVEQANRTPYGVHVAAVADAEGLAFDWSGARFESRPLTVELGPGETREWTFLFSFDTVAAPAVPSVTQSSEDALAGAIRRVEDVYARLPRLKGKWERFENLMLKSAGQLLDNSVLERSMDGSRVPTIRGGKTGLDGTWFWDTAIYIQALGLLGEKETAQGAVRLLLGGIDETGAPPAYYVEGRYSMTYQQPTLAWGVVKLDARCPDTAFLREARPALERYVEHWRRDYTRPESGLVCFPARGVCWDDALRWQDRFPVAFQEGEDWASKDWGGMCSTRFENVDTNTHLYLEYRALETICRRLDDAASADQWAARAEALAERINALLYDPERGIYQDRAVADGRFTGMLTLAAFLPVYAGFAPVAAARRMCRRYLLNPDHFNTPMPFCTLDRSHPAFRSGGFLQTVPQVPGALAPQAYWIGRAWPNVNTWMLGALWKAGLKREAEEAAWRLLDTMDRFETTHETYDPLSGMPGGHPECSHGGSAALIYAHGLYKV